MHCQVRSLYNSYTFILYFQSFSKILVFLGKLDKVVHEITKRTLLRNEKKNILFPVYTIKFKDTEVSVYKV